MPLSQYALDLTNRPRTSANSRLFKAKPHKRVPSRHGPLREDDSLGELGSALLEDASDGLMPASAHSHATPPTRSQSSSSKILSKFSSKALSSSPPALVQPDRSSSRTAKAALAQKTTNMKAFSRNRKTLKQSISSPIQQTLDFSSDDRYQTTRSSDDAATTFSTTTGAADLSKKISNLLTVSKSKVTEGSMEDKEYTLARAGSRTDRLQRGRKAFAKAGKAIVERFSNSIERNARKDYQDSDTLSNRTNFLLAPGVDVSDDTASDQMSRRVAEGTNLNNPKIRSLTGDGNILRKPLPVHESMKRPSQKDRSLEHRFSDSHRPYHASSRHGSSGLDVDIGTRKSRPTSMQEPLLMQGLRGELYQPAIDLSPLDEKQHSGFSEAISGLAQHPNVNFFSSSPDGSSTPRVRLEPTYTSAGKKRLTIIPSNATSLLDPSFQGENITSSSDELASSLRSKVARSLSLKRKSAKEDLRNAGTRPSKKPRKVSVEDKEETVLASGIDKLETQDASALKSKDTNSKVGRVKREGSKGKGLGIFDTVKNRGSESLPTTGVKKLRRRPSKRSSIPKPVGKISGHDRRASSLFTVKPKDVANNGQNSNDRMDVDDLHLDLSEYNLGTKKS